MANLQAVPAASENGSSSKQFARPEPKTTQVCGDEEFRLRNMNSLKFIVQIAITTFMLMLCWQGLRSKDANDRALYWGGITGVIGWWMPSPGSSSSNKVTKSEPTDR